MNSSSSNIRLEKDNATNYYNVTQLVKSSHKKDLKEWVKIQNNKDSFYKTINPNHHEWHKFSYKSNGNIYVNKELTLDVASWVSPEYYIKCSKMINKK